MESNYDSRPLAASDHAAEAAQSTLDKEEVFACYVLGQRHYVSASDCNAAKAQVAKTLGCNQQIVIAVKVRVGEQLELSL